MRKRFFSATLSMMILLLVLMRTTPTVFAAPARLTTAHRAVTVRSSSRCFSRCGPVLNQHFHGNTYSHLQFTFHGNNLNNTGNQGRNYGYNENYGGNGGNLTTINNKPHFPSIHQYFSGNSYSWDRIKFTGHNLNNTGNQGRNYGYSVNYGGNGGNMIVNRARSGHAGRVSQYFSGNSYSHGTIDFVGSNENNSGNQGLNYGHNEDHGGNAGNTIIN